MVFARLKQNVAECNNLVTIPPKQQQFIDAIKVDLDELNCVEITVTYKPQLSMTTDITLKEITEGIFRSILDHKYCSLHLYHEYSDGGRFHYHGILSGCTKKLLSTIRKQFTIHIGRIEIKTITYMESYLRYMTKQVNEIDYDTSLNIII